MITGVMGVTIHIRESGKIQSVRSGDGRVEIGKKKVGMTMDVEGRNPIGLTAEHDDENETGELMRRYRVGAKEGGIRKCQSAYVAAQYKMQLQYKDAGAYYRVLYFAISKFKDHSEKDDPGRVNASIDSGTEGGLNFPSIL